MPRSGAGANEGEGVRQEVGHLVPALEAVNLRAVLDHAQVPRVRHGGGPEPGVGDEFNGIRAVSTLSQKCSRSQG